MNRNITNVIRFFMDECLPPVIRDNRFFMYPFFFLAYRGRNIQQVMRFKEVVYNFTPEEYASFYNSLNSISRNRLTDLSSGCVKYILDTVRDSRGTLIDIGCASGYLLKKIHERNTHLKLSGFDIKKFDMPEYIQDFQGDIHNLPFGDKSFDIVTCCHTIEHLVDLKKCIHELTRIAKKEIIIVTPCQRPYFYTLDEHVNFFFYKETLTALFPLKKFTCHKINSDWLYHGYIE